MEGDGDADINVLLLLLLEWLKNKYWASFIHG